MLNILRCPRFMRAATELVILNCEMTSPALFGILVGSIGIIIILLLNETNFELRKRPHAGSEKCRLLLDRESRGNNERY